MISNRIENINKICQKVNIEPIINDNPIENQCLDFIETIRKIKFYDNQQDEQLEYITGGKHGLIFKGFRKTNADINNKDSKDNKYNKDDNILEYTIKVISYLKSDYINDINDINYENSEVDINQILSYFVVNKKTPHILLPMFTFSSNIDIFFRDNIKNVFGNNNNKYLDFVKKYNDNEYHDKITILATEWANRGDFLEFLKKYNNNQLFDLIYWKIFLFQIISALAVIQSKYRSFRHNNLGVNNIFVMKTYNISPYYKYMIMRNKYEVPNIGYSCLIGNFDFANINGLVENPIIESESCKKIGLLRDQNRYYDLHYFFATLIMFSAKCGIIIPPEIREFINRVIPEKYQKLGNKFVDMKGRLMVNDEYIIPKDILEKDILFAEFKEMSNLCDDIVIESDEFIIL